jgi:tetratricopeptide (TPR) repeat protein
VEHSAGRERVRETVRIGPWVHVYEDLSGRDPVSLAAVELEALAEAAWWLCKTDESIAARQRAYAAFRDAKDDRGAARAAARLFHDHFYRGEGAVAVGWLRRGFRHLEGAPDCVEGGWLQMAEAELHLHQGPLEQAEDGAAHAIQVARDHGDADLAAVAMQIQGRALVAQGRIEEGLALLDEAERLRALVEDVDRISEIPNSLRSGTQVRLTRTNVEQLLQALGRDSHVPA